MSTNVGRRLGEEQDGLGCGPEPFLRRILDAEERPAVTRKIEWAIFVVACLLALWLNIVLYQHSGAFWRDETTTLSVATAPDLKTMWANLVNDSAPPLFSGSLRLWIAAGPGATDDGLRLFGTLISSGIIVSLFVSCWMFTARPPLLALSLVPFNVTVFYYCSSLRAYGLAALLIMPCCAAFWRLSRQPSRWNVFASLVLAILCCHASYQNSYVLLAIGLAGAGACAACRLWKRSILILAICFIAAVSMLVYLPIIREYREIVEISPADMGVSAIIRCFAYSVSLGSIPMLCAWFLLGLAATACMVIQVVRQRGSIRTAPSLSLYIAIVAIVAVGANAGFVLTHKTFPHAWQYAPLIAIAGIIMEVLFRSQYNKVWVWLARVTTACIMIAISLPLLWGMAHLRRTNMDRVGSFLAETAGPDDFILVNPFSRAPSFKYNYRGNTEWNILPLAPSAREAAANPFGEFKRLMTTPNAIAPTLKKMEETLAKGNRLWIVGDVQPSVPGTAPTNLPPAPQSPSGWNCQPYLGTWSMQVDHFIRTHAIHIDVVPLPIDQEVSKLENEPVTRVEGWRE